MSDFFYVFRKQMKWEINIKNCLGEITLKFVWRKKGILDGKLLSYGDRIVLINPV
jgi:hypothetical protein